MNKYPYKRILVTGGAGFIGSTFIEKILNHFSDFDILNIDKLTYASSHRTLNLFNSYSNYSFKEIDISEFANLKLIVDSFLPDLIINFAAESHVDNSISFADEFVQSNILGTYNLLQIALELQFSNSCLFHHISTDEVYGDLQPYDDSFTEQSNFRPSSPYSSTKAAADLLVMAWGRTYKLPFLITNCSNNYGPRQHIEKLIPKIIVNAMLEETIPIYGDGKNIRDWIYVEDHINAIFALHNKNIINEVFNIGGNNERANIDLTYLIINQLNKYPNINVSKKSIKFVKDRKGHDLRYAIDSSKLIKQTNWKPLTPFDEGIKLTIDWYLENSEWWIN